MRFLMALSILVNLFVTSSAYSTCYQRPITVGIIDTGFGYEGHGKGAKLCKFGHRDFTLSAKQDEPIGKDYNGHGTNIAGIIEKLADGTGANYCLVILRYTSGVYGEGHHNIQATVDAINWAADIHLDFINYSSGGDYPSEPEHQAIKRFLAGGGTFVAAAGNDGWNLDVKGNNYFPASYGDKGMIVVGSLGDDGVKLNSSNYGSVVNRWELGYKVVGFGIQMTGTSQAAAVASGKLVSQTYRCMNVPARR
jgi:major intracellular serine protease